MLERIIIDKLTHRLICTRELMNQHGNMAMPSIHKRASSLPQQHICLFTPPDSPETIVPDAIAPVPPLKVGRHSRSRSCIPGSTNHSYLLSHMDSSEQVNTGLFHQLKAETPPIPRKHHGRRLVSAWLSQTPVNDKPESEDSLSDDAPSLVHCSGSSDSSLNQVTALGLVGMGISSVSLHARHNCIRELYYSEKQFSRELNMTIRYLFDRASTDGIREKYVALLLSNIPELYDISCCLVGLFEQFVPVNILTNRHAIDEREQPSNVGRAMCIYLNADMYRGYERYVLQHATQMRTFKKLLRRFQDLNFSVVEDEDKELSLRSLLQKPVQRLAQYSMYLSNIKDLLPPGHLDLKDLETAYERSRSYCYSINTRMQC